MTPDRFLELILAEGTIKTAAFRSKYEANIKLDKLKENEFPHAIISQLVPSDEVWNAGGWFDSTYNLSVLVVTPVKLTEEYPVKVTIKESLRSACRQVLINANAELMKVGTEIINNFKITGLIDVKFDRNCIACEFIINLPHTDRTQIIC